MLSFAISSVRDACLDHTKKSSCNFLSCQLPRRYCKDLPWNSKMELTLASKKSSQPPILSLPLRMLMLLSLLVLDQEDLVWNVQTYYRQMLRFSRLKVKQSTKLQRRLSKFALLETQPTQMHSSALIMHHQSQEKTSLPWLDLMRIELSAWSLIEQEFTPIKSKICSSGATIQPLSIQILSMLQLAVNHFVKLSRMMLG